MKIYRSKRRSCPMCKPHKMGFAPRYKNKVLAKLKDMDKEIRNATN